MNQIPKEPKCHRCPCWYICGDTTYYCNLYSRPIGDTLLDRLPICLKERPKIVTRQEGAPKNTCTCGWNHLIGRIHDPGCMSHRDWKSGKE